MLKENKYLQDGLGLTEEQVDILKKANLEFRKSNIKLTAQTQLAQIDLEEHLDNENVSEQKLLEALELVSTTQLSLKKNSIQFLYKVKTILGQQNFQRLKELISSKRKGHEKRGKELKKRDKDHRGDKKEK